MNLKFCYFLALAGALMLGSEVLAQAPSTVWHALGIPQAYKHIHDSTFNRKGKHPKLERKPPLKKLADAANLKSDVPAIKKAAEIKAQEDLAPQKIKAIKYLGLTGCGCYGGVAEALAAALEDCTEEVRYQASLAIVQGLSTNCQICQKTCCTKALAAKMHERAYAQDDEGCFIEPSERVRAVLMQALNDCPPDTRDLQPDIIDPLRDPGGGVPSLRDAPSVPRPEPPGGEEETFQPQFDGAETSANPSEADLPGASSRRGGSPNSLLHRSSSSRAASDGYAEVDASLFEPAPPVQMVTQEVSGQVVEGKSRRGFVRVLFDHNTRPPVGTELDVYHQYILGTEFAGRLVIAEYEGAYAIAGPRPWDSVKVARGDTVQCLVMVPAPATATAPPAPLPLPLPPTPVEAEPVAEHQLDAPLLDILQPPPVVVEPVEDADKAAVVPAAKQPAAKEAASQKEVVPASAHAPVQPGEEAEHLAPIVLPPRVIKRC